MDENENSFMFTIHINLLPLGREIISCKHNIIIIYSHKIRQYIMWITSVILYKRDEPRRGLLHILGKKATHFLFLSLSQEKFKVKKI